MSLLVGKLGHAHVQASKTFADFISKLSDKINIMADGVEKAHGTKLERHAP